MKHLFIACCSTLFCLHSSSQTTTVDVDKQNINRSAFDYLNTAGGVPFVNTKFARLVSGSPFFKDDMMKGAFISTEGTEYKNIVIRLNLLESQVNYMDKNRNEMIVGTPLREVVILDTINRKDHRFISYEYIESTDKPEKDFYELLQSGKVQLYKQYKKRMTETLPYGSATYEQSIRTDIGYYVLVNGKWIKIRKTKELADQLADKKNEIQSYISEKKLTKDNQENLEAIVAYYNTLSNQK